MYSPVSSLSRRTACLRLIKRRADPVRRSWSGCSGRGRGSCRQASSSLYGRIPNSGCSGLSSTLCCRTISFGIRVSVSTKPGHCSRVGALLPMVGAVLEELVLLLRGLRNQISSSAHSSVVQGHVEFLSLGSSLVLTRSQKDLSQSRSSKEETRLLAGKVQN